MTATERQEQRKEWEERISTYKASGLSMKAWCAANDVKVHQLYYRLGRRRVVKSSDSQPVWLEVTPDLDSQSQGLCVRVGKAIIEIRPGFDERLLVSVVRALAGC